METVYLYSGAKLTVSTEKPFTGHCGILLHTAGVFASSSTDCSGCFTTTQGTVLWDSVHKELYVA